MKRSDLIQGHKYIVKHDGNDQKLVTFRNSEVRPRAPGRTASVVFVCLNKKGKICVIPSLEKFLKEVQ